jgi:hydrogenase nickel incorporation protein HypB
MCASCGCSDENGATLTDLKSGVTVALRAGHGYGHSHPHLDRDHHGHTHDDTHAHGHHHHHHGDGDAHHATITLEKEILARNDKLAERNRGWLAGRGVVALNLVSSPGSGKTTLLERTIRDLGQEVRVAVIEGDQQTLNDARRIEATGSRVVQINTGTACHLDAAMVARGLEQLEPPSHSIVMIENVGNLVCPALFDLGERAKVVIVSVTEGDDKPIKYPHMFRASTLLLLNKIDLLPYVLFDVERFLAHARQVNPRLQTLQVSATQGDGLAEWYQWVRAQVSAAHAPEGSHV